MGDGFLAKRAFLKAAGSLIALGYAARANGQELRLFGLDIPDALADLLPQKPLQYAQLAEAVIALEKEADLRRLPQSVLSRDTGLPIAALDDAIYQVVLPRLVALIDRAEAVDPRLADKAGGLLAQVHQTQHELPEALGALRLLSDAGEGRGLFHRAAYIQEQPAPPDPLPSVEALPADIPMVSEEIVQALPVPQADPPAPPAADDAPLGPLSRAKSFATLREEYRRMFNRLEIRAERAQSVDWHVTMIRASRARYERAGARTKVPWFFIAVTHALESSFNFRAHLHNGDFPLSARTRQVPAGRPRVWLPPSDWEASAVDAMNLLGFAGQADWSLERTLYRLEAYNGFGYRGVGVPTPYLWSFSNHYERGKFVADGRFNRTARSQQCGAAVMLKALANAGEVSWAELA